MLVNEIRRESIEKMVHKVGHQFQERNMGISGNFMRNLRID